MNADDLKAIDLLIARFFAAFDNREGRSGMFETMRGLFAERAIIAKYDQGECQLLSPDEFARPRAAMLEGGRLTDFHEWEETASTQVIGGIATRTSRYAKSGLLDGEPYGGSGAKFFQLARFASGWRIVALSWIDDGT